MTGAFGRSEVVVSPSLDDRSQSVHTEEESVEPRSKEVSSVPSSGHKIGSQNTKVFDYKREQMSKLMKEQDCELDENLI